MDGAELDSPDGLDSTLRRLRDGLAALYGDRLDRVLLYGSRARGDARSDSDVDVLVILRGEVDPVAEIRRTEYLVADMSLAHDIVFQCVFVGVDEMETGVDAFLYNVRREALAV